jgi:glycosyltransferase involved in cell wall biosynthesis
LRGPNLRIPFLFEEYPYLPSLGGKLIGRGFDVIHAHSHLFLTSLQAATACMKGRTPFVVTVHGVFAKRGFFTDIMQKAYLHTLGRRIFTLASRVICVSKGDAYEVIALGCPASKIRVIPNPVDGQQFRPGPSKRAEDEVLWVGRFVPEKGLEYLIKALKLILAKRKITLRLVGDGPQRTRIESLVKQLDLSKQVIFEGEVSYGEVARIMSEASVFALPSIKEGLPKVLLEAMASELAIVSAAIPGVSEVITNDENGLLVEPKSAEGLAKAILTLLGDRSHVKRLGTNARRNVMQNYSWESTLKALDRVYEEACVNDLRRECAGSASITH